MSFIRKNMKKIGISLLSLTILITSIKMDFITEANTKTANVELTTDDTFESNGGQYTAEHIFSQYNVFSFGDVTSMHINGAIISQEDLFSVSSIDMNKLTYTKGVGGVAFSDTTGDFKTLNSSYIKGLVEMKYSVNQPINFYVGLVNDLKYENWRYTINGKNANTESKAIYETDTYVDWDKAYSNLKAESKKMAQVAEFTISEEDIKQRGLETYVLVKPGQQIVIPEHLHDQIDYLMFESKSIFDTELTIISYLKGGQVRELPIKYGASEAGQHHNNIETGWHPGSAFGSYPSAQGINIINNYPYATTIVNNGNSGAAFSTGQILALDATIYNTAGNINGNQIVKNIYTTSEIHMWPLSVPITLPKTVDVNVSKTWLGKIGEAVTVELLADGHVKETVVLNEENQWQHEFSNLKEKNQQGKVIEYSVNEVDLDKYQGEIKNLGNHHYEIINKNYGETALTINKKWLGFVENFAKVDLLANGEIKETIELREENNWTYTFEKLPEYDDKGIIEYSIKEHDSDKYNAVIKETPTGFDIINDNRGITDVSVKKTWLGLQGEAVKVNLLADKKIIDTVTLDDTNQWNHVFKNLPKLTNAGKAIVYEVEELNAEKYNPQIIQSGNSFEIINTNLVDREIEITKEWIGKAEGPVIVELLANGKVLKSAELNPNNEWHHVFDGLYTYDAKGEEIKYTVNEVDGEQYNYQIESTDTGFKLINTHFGKTHVDITKTWRGEIGEFVEVELMGNNQFVTKTVLNNTNNWHYRFDDLPLYDTAGNEIIYTVNEVNGDLYDAKIVELDKNSFEIINTNLGDRDLTVNKKWRGHVEGPVTIKLFKNGNGLKEIELSHDNNWTHTFSNLEKFNPDGTEIKYTIEELGSDQFEKVDIQHVNGQFTITNTNLKETSINVQKKWIGQQEDHVVIELYKDSKKIETVQLDESNHWMHEFKNQPVYNDDGSKIYYEIKEVNGHLYDAKINELSENNYEVTNTNLGLTNVEVKKTWIGKAIDEVEVNLMANGSLKDTHVLNSSNNWSTTFDALHKYDNNGTPIEYTITESNGELYDAKIKKISDNSFEVINTNLGSKDIVINKSWIGKKEEVIVHLLANAELRDSVKLNDKNNWTHTFSNLDEYDAMGQTIDYTLDEENGDQYKVEINQEGNTFNITNTNKGKTNVSIKKTWLGKAEKEVQATLMANDVKVNQVLLNDQNNWSHVFENLEKYDDDGHIINYAVEEVNGDQYDAQINEISENEFEIINTNTGIKTLSISKTWIGKQEDLVKVNLLADHKVNQTVILNEENAWFYEFENLPLYNHDGTEIVYAIEEVDGEKYNVENVQQSTNHIELINTNKGSTSVDVKKEWIGAKAEQVVVDLLANEKVIKTVSLSEENGWKYHFDNLSLYDDNGQEINYSVAEKDAEQYSGLIEEIKAHEFVITNKNLGERSLHINKEWIGKQEGPVVVKLYKNGNGINDVTLSQDNNWSFTFEKLEKYNHDGTEAIYTIEEMNSEQFDVEIIEQDNGYKIINTHLGDTSVEVVKKWIGEAEESIDVELLANDQVIETVALNASNQWKHKFEHLDKYDVHGETITYTVHEVDGNRFNAVTLETKPNTFEITNTNLGLTKVDVKKTWIGKAVNEVEIELYANEQILDKVILNDQNDWFHSFNDLDKFDADGNLIKYTVDEVDGSRYDYTIKEIAAQSFEIINTNTGQTQVDVKKVWNGKAEEVEINLLGNETLLETVNLNDMNEWKHSFTNLPKYDAAGKEITYTVKETNGDLFNAKIETIAHNSYEITNTNLGKTKVTVDKLWKGKAEESVTIELYADDNLIQSMKLSEENQWTHTFENLEKYTRLGEKIEYTIKEVDAEKYNASIKELAPDHFQVENTNLGKTQVDVKKTWIGKAENDVEITLLADLQEISTITLSPDNDWKYTFIDLDKYHQDGREIVYSVKELNDQDFDAEIKELNVNSFEIINTNLGTTSRKVEKDWIGKITGPITVELYKDNVKYKEVSLGKDNVWSYVFKNLDVYNKDGSHIRYEIKEVFDATFDVSSKVVGDTTKITNKNLGETEVNVTKRWIGKKESAVIINLLANGDIVDTVELNQSNSWSHGFKQLDKYDKHGHEIIYTVDEVNGKNFDYEVVETAKNSYEITNKNLQETSVNVKKIWNGKIEEFVEINLFADDLLIDTIKLNDENAWHHEFNKLDKYDTDGHEIDYTVQEVNGDLYNATVTQVSLNNYEITNHNLQETDVSITKEWIGKKEEATVYLYADEKLVDQVSLNAETGWTYTFENLQKYTKTGQEIKYSVQEQDAMKYDATIEEISKNDFVITNTNLGQTEVSVKKQWIGKANNEVVIHLLANGTKIETVTLSDDNSWLHKFEGLDRYESNGQEISYTIEEIDAELFNAEIIENEKNSFEIINKNHGNRSIEITKTWQGTQLESVEVDILANGKWIDTVTLTNEGNWTYTLDDLNDYDENGVVIDYTIVEKYYDNYDVILSGDADEGFVLHNIEITPAKPDKPKEVSPESKEPEKPSDSDVLAAEKEPTLPRTGMGFSTQIYLGGILSMIGLIIKRKSKK
ncbi:Cna B-type domain-containing protein [Erysipelothrix urinaevulpis]|uniref:Cna B-type domain-containing protein n=1 Tax=Erysipelothrix urinaevulpis TaxID=2683717 RepID=UPI0019160983|nr:Cna B-type domain-containing protein [Erysipelothrix urinaevulpis]